MTETTLFETEADRAGREATEHQPVQFAFQIAVGFDGGLDRVHNLRGLGAGKRGGGWHQNHSVPRPMPVLLLGVGLLLPVLTVLPLVVGAAAA